MSFKANKRGRTGEKETLDPKIWAAYEVGPTSGPRGQSTRRVGEYPRGLEP